MMLGKLTDSEKLVSEKLVSVDHRRQLHAIFPTALRTLCGIQFQAKGEGMTLQPDCPECNRVIRAWASNPDIARCWPRDWRTR